MGSEGRRPRWQFSLRSFLFAVLIIGPLAAVAGPIILEAITEWKPPAQPVPPAPKYNPVGQSTQPENYYESGETPLH